MIKKALLVMCAAALSGAVWAAAPLDGTTWKVQLTPDSDAAAAGQKAFHEKLSFAAGRVTPSAKGFSTAAYQTADDAANPGRPLWMAQTTGTAGSAEWRGQLRSAGAMDGTMTQTTTDGKVAHYTFKAAKR